MREGILDSTQLIDTIIVSLNSIPVSGVESCIKIVDCVQKLGALRQAVEDLEAYKNDQNHDG